MLKKLITLGLLLVLIISAITGLTSPFAVYDIQPSNISLTPHTWFPLANGSHNAFVMWRWEPVLSFTAYYLYKFFISSYPQLEIAQIYNGIALFIGTCFSFLLFRHFHPNKKALISTLAWLGIILLGYGSDSVIIDSFTFFPLYFLALDLYFTQGLGKKRLFFLLLVIYSALELVITANQLAFILILIPLIILLQHRKLKITWHYFLLLIPSIIYFFITPVPSNFDYPSDISAHLVSDDGLSGMIRPLVGPEAPTIPTIDRPFIKNAYSTCSALLLLFVIIVGIPSAWKLKSKTMFGWCLLLSLSLVLDVICDESLSHIMPLATINRLIPQVYFFSLTPLACALTFFLLLLHLQSTKTEFYALFLVAILFPANGHPVLQSPIATRAKQELAAINDNQLKQKNEKFLVSPSLHVLNSLGIWILENLPQKNLIDVAKLDPAVKFFDSDESTTKELHVLKDHNWHTRWSTSQTGNEWLLMRFNQVHNIDVIEPTPSNHFYTDFPRGIRISVAKDCSLKEPLNANYEQVFIMPEWQGELLFTPQGYPYFGHHSHVRVSFKEPIAAKCWLIERTGKITSDFDWSIAKIKVHEKMAS